MRSLETRVARICTADLAAVYPGTASSARSQVVAGLDGLPNPAVAVGAVQSTSPSRGPFGGTVSLIARHGPQTFLVPLSGSRERKRESETKRTSNLEAHNHLGDRRPPLGARTFAGRSGVETDWIGHTLAVGDGVRLRVTVADPR